MNKARRKEIEKVEQRIHDLRGDLTSIMEDMREAMSPFINKLRDLSEAYGSASGSIDDIKSEEEDYRDNMPESMQSGDKYDTAENAISELENAITEVDQIVSEIDAFIEVAFPEDTDEAFAELDGYLQTACNHLESARES